MPANQEVVLEEIEGDSLEIHLEIVPGPEAMFELNVFRSPDVEEITRIHFFRDRGFMNRGHRTGPQQSLISIDTSRSSILPDSRSRAPETAPVTIAPDEPLSLRVFLDRSVVEVFVNGQICLAVRVYPGRDDSRSVSLYSRGSASRVRSIDAWTMRSIHA